MAIADMDSDGYADIITINNSENSFTILLLKHFQSLKRSKIVNY